MDQGFLKGRLRGAFVARAKKILSEIDRAREQELRVALPLLQEVIDQINQKVGSNLSVMVDEKDPGDEAIQVYVFDSGAPPYGKLELNNGERKSKIVCIQLSDAIYGTSVGVTTDQYGLNNQITPHDDEVDSIDMAFIRCMEILAEYTIRFYGPRNVSRCVYDHIDKAEPSAQLTA